MYFFAHKVIIAARKYFGVQIGNAADEWYKDDQPYPPGLFVITYTMDHTEYLQRNVGIIVIATAMKQVEHNTCKYKKLCNVRKCADTENAGKFLCR